jgi:hypothetical protein
VDERDGAEDEAADESEGQDQATFGDF